MSLYLFSIEHCSAMLMSVISIENCRLRKNSYEFTRDLLECYKECKSKTVASRLTFDACIWGNKEMTGLWNKVL